MNMTKMNRNVKHVVAASAVLASISGCDKFGTAIDAPVFSGTPNTHARVGIDYGVTVVAVDPDGDPVEYSLVTGPAGMTIGEDTGTLAWTPAEADVGQHLVQVQAEDEQGLETELAWTVVVGHNQAPVIEGFLEAVCIADGAAQLTVTDPEGDAVTVEVDGAPAGFDVDPATGAVALSAAPSVGGTLLLNVRATDEFGASSFREVPVEFQGFTGSATLNTRLSDPMDDADDAQVAAAPDGSTVFVYTQEDDETDGDFIVLTRILPSGCGGTVKVNASEDGAAYGYSQDNDVAVAPDGSIYVAWYSENYEEGDYEVRVQRFDANLAPLWGPGGVVARLTADYQDEYNPVLFADDSGAIVTFYEDDSGYTWIQKLSPEGSRLWGPDGIQALDDYVNSPSIASDGVGGAILVWYDSDVYGQRFAALDGASMWPFSDGEQGRLLFAVEDGYVNESPHVVGFPGGGVVIAGSHYDYETDMYHIFTNRIAPDGSAPFGTDGIRVHSQYDYPGSTYVDRNVAVTPSGRILLTWLEDDSLYEVFVQSVDGESGEIEWDAAIGLTGGAIDDPDYPSIVVDGEDAIVVWPQEGLDEDDIWAQRVDANGSLLWTGGRALTQAQDCQYDPRAVVAGGRLVAVWEDCRDGVFTQSIRANGELGP